MPGLKVRTFYVGFQVLTATNMKLAVFWHVVPNDAGIKCFRNVGQYKRDYKA
jgi:hypothetical protein